MAVCRLGRPTINVGQASLRQASSSAGTSGRSLKWGAKQFGALGGAGLFAGLFIGGQVLADQFAIKGPHMPWQHHKPSRSFDHRALRRGYQVYSQVCAACHSQNYNYWRELVNVTHTEKEVKALAAEHVYEDGPNEEGLMYERPGKPYDAFPKPYKNKKEARAANNGAFPPDLSCICRARHGENNYVFHLLTGYYDTPAGFELGENMYFNAYFLGNAISMAPALYPGVMTYEEGDDTPATVSQMAKDVVEYLDWSGEKYQEKRKLGMIKFLIASGFMSAGLYMLWRRSSSYDFTRHVMYMKMPKRK